jgi:hypothetical protein
MKSSSSCSEIRAVDMGTTRRNRDWQIYNYEKIMKVLGSNQESCRHDGTTRAEIGRLPMKKKGSCRVVGK